MATKSSLKVFNKVEKALLQCNDKFNVYEVQVLTKSNYYSIQRILNILVNKGILKFDSDFNYYEKINEVKIE